MTSLKLSSDICHGLLDHVKKKMYSLPSHHHGSVRDKRKREKHTSHPEMNKNQQSKHKTQLLFLVLVPE